MIMKEFDVVAFEFKKVDETELVLRIQPVKGLYSQEQETLILQTFDKYIGKECKLSIEYVERFDTMPNGKRRYFYNEIDS